MCGDDGADSSRVCTQDDCDLRNRLEDRSRQVLDKGEGRTGQPEKGFGEEADAARFTGCKEDRSNIWWVGHW
jgi:hypothetical protein